MSIKESMLNIVSDLAQNDYIRAVTYGGYSRRVEVSELAKSVVEDYTGSSLAGENQSVQGAFSALETEIQNVEQDVTAEINDAIVNILPTDTAAGEIASFPDGSDLSPALSVLAGIEPVQDLHGYDAPWVGGAGKNKLAPWFSTQTKYGVTWTVNADGTFTSSGTASQNSSQIATSNIVLPDGTYIINGCPTGGSGSTYFLRVLLYDSNNTIIEQWSDFGSEKTFTIDSATTAYIKVFVSVNNGQTAPSGTWKPMIRLQGTDATYAPYDNICPISGRDAVGVSVVGKNFFINNLTSGTTNQVTHTVNSDGSISLSGTASANCFLLCSQPYYLNGGTYTMRGSGNVGIQMQMRVNAAAGANKFNATTTNVTGSIDSGNYVSFIRIASGTNCNGITLYPQLELGTTATEYEPYNEQSYTTQLGQTVYGGTLTYTYADGAASWAMTVEYGYKVFDGSESWLLNPSYPHNFGVQLPNAIKWNDVTGVRANGVSDKYVCQYYTSAQRPNCVLSLYAGVFYGVTSDKWCVIRDDRFNTVDEFKTWLASNNVQLAYELATPTTIQLTETQVVELFKGYNNVFSDAGDMSVTYKADIQLYIDKQTNELRVAILALS